ncbi:MAG TPA: YebC/PmpR family DNA-binding transcriptional regulator [Candidatus Izemoplasmatales bacterium]|nr:YebC/PmpR family DNA-binding transcriptional regulator [Bacillota bacterium]HRY78585.1 YebC/PmpR family DNA-binding transcriptional regulator [Candidatus Izemoplasmatales bacterium]
MGRAHEVRAASMAKTAAMKSKLYSKYGKEIYMAARNGADPNGNLTLKKWIEKAKAEQVPADVIKRNIDKAKGGAQENYENVRYEGFGPGNSMIIIECMTDNVNRTFGEVRACFTKTGGKVGVAGSVAHQFTYVALVTVEEMTEDEVFEAMLNAECDVQDVQAEDGMVTITGQPNDLDKIKEALIAAKPDVKIVDGAVTYLPQTYVTLSEDDLRKYRNFIAMTDEIDDIQEVFSNVDVPVSDEE